MSILFSKKILKKYFRRYSSKFVKTFLFLGRWLESNQLSPKGTFPRARPYCISTFLSEVVHSTSPPSIPLLYHTLRNLSRGNFKFLWKFVSYRVIEQIRKPFLGTSCSLLTFIIISDFLKMSILFQKFFWKYFLDEFRLNRNVGFLPHFFIYFLTAFYQTR